MPSTAPTTTTRKRTSQSQSKSSNSTTTTATTTTTSATAKQQQQQKEPQYWLREEEMKLRYGIQTYGRGNWTRMANSPLFRNSRSSKQLRFKVRSEVKKYGDAYWTENQQTLEDYVDEMNTHTHTDTTDFLRLLRSGPAPASASSLPRPPPRTPWTEDEEMRLIYGIRTYGRTAWKQIAETLLPARKVKREVQKQGPSYVTDFSRLEVYLQTHDPDFAKRPEHTTTTTSSSSSSSSSPAAVSSSSSSSLWRDMYQRLVEHNLKNEGKQRRGRHPMASDLAVWIKAQRRIRRNKQLLKGRYDLLQAIQFNWGSTTMTGTTRPTTRRTKVVIHDDDDPLIISRKQDDPFNTESDGSCKRCARIAKGIIYKKAHANWCTKSTAYQQKQRTKKSSTAATVAATAVSSLVAASSSSLSSKKLVPSETLVTDVSVIHTTVCNTGIDHNSTKNIQEEYASILASSVNGREESPPANNNNNIKKKRQKLSSSSSVFVRPAQISTATITAGDAPSEVSTAYPLSKRTKLMTTQNNTNTRFDDQSDDEESTWV